MVPCVSMRDRSRHGYISAHNTTHAHARHTHTHTHTHTLNRALNKVLTKYCVEHCQAAMSTVSRRRTLLEPNTSLL